MAPSMWQQTEEMAKKHDQSGSLWLKLANDGDKAIVVFLGEPFPREVCFVDGKYLPYDEKAKAQGGKASLRVALNVAIYESKEVKVLEQGVVFFKDLVRIRGKYGLEKWAFEVQRHGAAKDPKTTYSILPEHQLSAEQQRAFQALPQHDLEKLYTEDAESGDGGAAAEPSGQAPKTAGTVDPKVAQSFAAQLKSMPRESVDRFLQKFQIQRIKDLPASQVDKARVFVEQLQAEHAAPGVSDADIDPFA